MTPHPHKTTPDKTPDRDLIGLVYNPHVAQAEDLIGKLVPSIGLGERSWTASAAALDIDADTLANTQVIITAGGDGTILRVARKAVPHSVPILGINMGRVGFMTEVTVDEAAEKIPTYLDGSPRVESRMMLQASVVSGSDAESGQPVHALNDVVVGRGPMARLLDLYVNVDGAPLATYRADGVIVSTATGSTGYALAAGGPILYPEARVMLVQPVAPHISLQTGIVVSEESVVEIGVSGGREATLSADAIADTILSQGDRVMVRRSPYDARFLRADPPATFYSRLTERLGVRGRPWPAKPSG